MIFQSFFALSSILFLAAFLRFYRLKERGLLYWDDGVRMREVLFMDHLITFVRKNFKQLILKEVSLRDVAQHFPGRYLFDINPLNILLYWITSRVTGNIEYSGLMTNAFFGVIGVLGTFFLGDLLFGASVGWISSLVFALSAYHLNYSRSIHAEGTCATFYVWATYFYLLSFKVASPLLVLVAGLLIGCAFASNSRQFYIPLFFICYELCSLSFQPFENLMSRAILLGTSMFLPLMVTEEFFLFLRVVGYPYPTYFMQLFERTGQRIAFDFKFPSFKIYWKTFLAFEGWIPLFFLVAGTLLLFRSFSYPNAVLLVQWLFPILFWSARPTQSLKVRKGSSGGYFPGGPRLLSSSLSAISIVVAVALAATPVSFFPYFLAVIMLNGLWHCWKIVRIFSGYKKAIEFIQNQGNISYVSFCHPISDYYARNNEEVVHFDAVKSEEDLREVFEKKKIKYLLYEPNLHQNVFRSLVFPYVEKVTGSLSPAFSIEHGHGQYYPFYCEEGCHDPIIFKPHLIQIYDLCQFFQKSDLTNHAGIKIVHEPNRSF